MARSTLADANEHRDWRLFAAVAEQLLRQARRCYSNDPSGLAEVEAIYALDASFIDLSLALCPWANWTGHDAAVKLHTLLDLRGSIPSWICITPAEAYETRVLSQLPIESGSYYVMDRGYQDFSLFRRFDQAGAFFVARAKCNVRFRVQHSRPVDRAAGLRCDQTVSLAVAASHRAYPDQLRRIRMLNTQEGSSLVLWTNQFELPALTISHLYQRRWQVELFFKWIKYNLRIRHFFGLSPNAVRIQLWSALAVYALIAIAKKRWVLPHSLHQILQILSACAFEKTPMDQLFTQTADSKADQDERNQLSFKDF